MVKSRYWARLLLLVITASLLVFSFAAIAFADDATTAGDAGEGTVAEAPALDYTFTWPTFILCFGLVIAYYIFIFRMSEKEFKGVVAERFGPKREQGGAG